MNLEEKFVLLFAFIIFITPAINSTLSGKITATDWIYRHSVWINQYLNGDFSAIFIYTPLFHFLMLLPVYFSVEIYFQVIFAVLSFFGILYMTKKLENEKVMLNVAVFLAVSIAFVEFSSALMPQALEYFLFPLAIIFYYQNKVKYFIPLLAVNFFIHIAGIMLMGILMIHSLATKRYKFFKILLVMIILLSPLFYYWQFIPIRTIITFWDWKAQIEWENLYMNPIWNFFLLSGALTWIALPYALYKLWRKKFKLTEMQLLYVIWIIAFLPLPIFDLGWWRMISYQIVPLTLLVASIINENISLHEKRFNEVFG